MTILPKKKSGQAKSNNPITSANSDAIDDNLSESNVGHVQNSDNRSLFPGRTTPPKGWSCSREEKRPSGTSSFDEFDSVETGPSHSKRRHRASPHRSLRNKLRGSNVGSCSTCLNLPSTSGNNCKHGHNASIKSGDGSSKCDDYSGYNSGDEYLAPPNLWLTEEEWVERERTFEKKLRKKGFLIKKMDEDGACLFRAVADQVYGDQEMHSSVRSHCMDYMAKNSDYFSQYITEDFGTYLNRKRSNDIHGNHVEMQALSEMYNRTMEVYHYNTDPINIIRGGLTSDNEPIRISYHKNTHYNSIVDPHKATIGVGLGLPELVPGLADKNLMCDAIRQSEELQLEQAMLEDKLKATDWEATNEAIEEQIARESYLQWLRDNEKQVQKQCALPRSSTATSSSSFASGASPGNRSPKNKGQNSAANSPARLDLLGNELVEESKDQRLINHEGTSCSTKKAESIACGRYFKEDKEKNEESLVESSSLFNQLPPAMFGLAEWDDTDGKILAQVLAASQQEYLDCLKRTAKESSCNDDTIS